MSVDAETALYTELWRACAGPLVTVPRQKELVYYFPQGHIEQVFLINFFYSNALSLMFIFRFMQLFFRFDVCTDSSPRKDPVRVPLGPVTRARAKRFEESLQTLVRSVQDQHEIHRNIEGLDVAGQGI